MCHLSNAVCELPIDNQETEINSKKLSYPAVTGRKLNVHKTLRRSPGCLLNVSCTFNLRPVSTGYIKWLRLVSDKMSQKQPKSNKKTLAFGHMMFVGANSFNTFIMKNSKKRQNKYQI